MMLLSIPGIGRHGGVPRESHLPPHNPMGTALRTATRPSYASGGSGGGGAGTGVTFDGGLLNSAVPGRTDHLPVDLPNGSYVLPADVVSGLGEGNTKAGASILDGIFSGAPRGFQRGPWNAIQPQGVRGAGPVPAPPQYQPTGYATGGAAERAKIIAAGGEYAVPPHVVAHIGDGNMKAGHDVLDAFVKHVRGETVRTMRKLPGPKKR